MHWRHHILRAGRRATGGGATPATGASGARDACATKIHQQKHFLPLRPSACAAKRPATARRVAYSAVVFYRHAPTRDLQFFLRVLCGE